MDEQNRVPEDLQPEDLKLAQEDAEGVKGGGGLTADDDWESPMGYSQKASPQLKPRGLDGVEHQHNETLVAL